jgi:peptide deformylase
MIRDILVLPDSRLRVMSLPVLVFDGLNILLVEEMQSIMLAHNGMGLAASQIGEAVRVAVYNFKPGYMINPRIVKIGGDLISHLEGCLSIPGVSGKVNRFDKVKVTFNLYDGEERTMTFKGYEAFCIQHEIDHFQGKS